MLKQISFSPQKRRMFIAGISVNTPKKCPSQVKPHDNVFPIHGRFIYKKTCPDHFHQMRCSNRHQLNEMTYKDMRHKMTK